MGTLLPSQTGYRMRDTSGKTSAPADIRRDEFVDRHRNDVVHRARLRRRTPRGASGPREAVQHRPWMRKSDILAPDIERAAPRAWSSGPTYLDKTPNIDSVAVYTW